MRSCIPGVYARDHLTINEIKNSITLELEAASSSSKERKKHPTRAKPGKKHGQPKLAQAELTDKKKTIMREMVSLLWRSIKHSKQSIDLPQLLSDF